jgi:quinol monooxygenase YgiN
MITIVARMRVNVDEETMLDIARRAVNESAREPGVLRYDWYYDKEAGTCDEVFVFASSQATIDHVRSSFGTSVLPDLLKAVVMERSDLYGNPSPELLEALNSRTRTVHRGPTVSLADASAL